MARHGELVEIGGNGSQNFSFQVRQRGGGGGALQGIVPHEEAADELGVIWNGIEEPRQRAAANDLRFVNGQF